MNLYLLSSGFPARPVSNLPHLPTQIRNFPALHWNSEARIDRLHRKVVWWASAEYSWSSCTTVKLTTNWSLPEWRCPGRRSPPWGHCPWRIGPRTKPTNRPRNRLRPSSEPLESVGTGLWHADFEGLVNTRLDLDWKFAEISGLMCCSLMLWAFCNKYSHRSFYRNYIYTN